MPGARVPMSYTVLYCCMLYFQYLSYFKRFIARSHDRTPTKDTVALSIQDSSQNHLISDWWNIPIHADDRVLAAENEEFVHPKMRWPGWGGCHQQQSGIWEAPYCWWQPEIRLHNQLRLVVYPIIHRGFIHPTGALASGFLPSAVATWLPPGNGPWLCASSSSWRLHGVLGVWRCISTGDSDTVAGCLWQTQGLIPKRYSPVNWSFFMELTSSPQILCCKRELRKLSDQKRSKCVVRVCWKRSIDQEKHVTLKRSEMSMGKLLLSWMFWTRDVNLLTDVDSQLHWWQPSCPKVLIVIAAVIYLQDSSKKESSNTEERPNLIFVF